MKILVVGPSDTMSKGGMATVISDIRNSEILNNKYDIDIFGSYIDGNIITRIFYCIYAYLKFLTCCKKYDLFHIHTACYGSTFRKAYYLKTIKKAGKKGIVHIHGAEFMVFYEKLNDAKKRKVIDFLKSADLVLALSEEWKKKFEETLRINNCKVLNNGIDTNKYKSAISDMSQNKNSFLLLGRLGKRKGAFDLVKAVEIAVNKNPAIKVYMAGDGEVDKVKAMVEEKRLENNIEVVGWVDFSKKVELLKKFLHLYCLHITKDFQCLFLKEWLREKLLLVRMLGLFLKL
jgi:glycosyltransferase involved in cell wall biosynthesis